MGNPVKNNRRMCLASAKEVILKKPAELKAKNTPIIRLFFVKAGCFAEFILEHSEGLNVTA